jgi:tetratricopeptide (TPR) repeat protein
MVVGAVRQATVGSSGPVGAASTAGIGVPGPLASPRHYLGHRLRVLRRAAGLSPRELSGLAQIDPAAIGRVERAEPDAGLHSVIEACDRVLGAGGELVELSLMILAAASDTGTLVNAAHLDRGTRLHSGGGVGTAGSPVPRQLPGAPRGFVGRERELSALAQAADEDYNGGDGGSGVRLVVLEGTAGAGKSALAVRFAHQMQGRFPDGQLFVNLRGYDPGPPLSPGAALERFLHALGVAGAAVSADLEERAELYRTLLAERSVLIVLDNAATAGQVRPLLPGGTGCLVLVTTRGRLSALSAREGARRITVKLLEQSEAVALIRQVTSDYRQDDDPAEVAALAALCAGLPLALRIAAERAAARPFLPLAELIGQLRAHSTLWDALSSDPETEADAVRTVFSWSYRTLPPAAARAFRRLGLHPGPDLGTGAAAALLDCPAHTAREMLDALAGAHLLEQTGPARYQFHDLLRAYAADQAELEEPPEERRAALERVTHWYLGAAHAAARAVQSIPRGPLDALAAPEHPGEVRFSSGRAVADWYRLERENLLALARAAAREHLDRALWRLVLALEDVLDAAGALDERREFGELGLQAARRFGGPLAEPAMLQTLAYAHQAAGEVEQAAARHRDALQACTRLGYDEGVVRASNGLGTIHLRRRELPEAIDQFEQVAATALAAGLGVWHAQALTNLAYARLQQGLTEQAAALAQQAHDAYQSAGFTGATSIDPHLIAAAAHRERGQYEHATEQIAAARRHMAGGERHLHLEAVLALHEAALDLAQGRAEQALETYWRCEQLGRPLADPVLEADTLTGTARALTALGRTGEALDFHRRALALRRAHPHDPYRLAEAEANLADTLDTTDAPAVEPDEARALRQVALARLEPFDDPRAVTLRTHLTEYLSADG